ncbi:MAG: DUF2461 domain-containing protein [Bacteroidetes bacterium]|nr:DUF2461 domain-containing protein [Bacteroidota bacterium]
MKKVVLDFLTQLEENNNREWFQKNKKQYDEAKAEVESFVNTLIPELAKFDDAVKYVEAKDCMFRIFRDVRFAKDKSPYKINMGAWITRAGRKSPGPGYYVHLQPGGSFLAAGVYMPEPDQLKKIRNEIYYNVSEFKAILEEKKLRKHSNGLLDNEKGKMAPRDFPKDFPDIELLKYKHYTLSTSVRDEVVASDHFNEIVLMDFKTMYPFNVFLKRALEE